MSDQTDYANWLRTLANKADFDGVIRPCPKALNRAANTIESLTTQLSEAQGRIGELEKLVYVPGVFKCQRCECVTVSTSLHVNIGTMSANNDPQQCPNNCGPMWRVTERSQREEAQEELEKLLTQEQTDSD